MSSQIKDLISSMNAELLQLEEFEGEKVFHVADEEDLFDETKMLQYPAVGVVYEGMRPSAEGQKASHRVGLSAIATFSIIVLTADKFPTGVNTKMAGLQILDRVRGRFRDKTGPSGHFWRFELEAPVRSNNKKVLVWAQRWSIPLMLTQDLKPSP